MGYPKNIYTLTLFFLLTFLVSISVASDNPAEKFITGKDGGKMVLVKGGKFIMGSDDEDIKELAPKHTVSVESFYMDIYEVTNEQFANFLNEVTPREGEEGVRYKWIVLRNDLENAGRAAWWPAEIIFEDGVYKPMEGYDKHPVMVVSWYAADEYCKWAKKRLPTEAEWEYAARGGLKEKTFPWGNAIPTGGVIFDRTWQSNEAPAPTAPVGSYYPNGYGLYDMAGNVWEWVNDWYTEDYYKDAPPENPKGPETSSFKVTRGGSWFNAFSALRVSLRNFAPPESLNEDVGFRCAKDVEE